jgi:hypothetical protein
MEFVGDGAIAGGGTAGGIGDPVRRVAINAADRLMADHERTDVTAGLAHELLDVERAVVKRAEGDFVLEERFGRVAVIDPCQEATPGTNGRFHHNWVPDLFASGQRRFRGEGDEGSRRRDTLALQSGRGQQLVRRRYWRPRMYSLTVCPSRSGRGGYRGRAGG